MYGLFDSQMWKVGFFFPLEKQQLFFIALPLSSLAYQSSVDNDMCLPTIYFHIFLKKKFERESLHGPFKLYLGIFVTKKNPKAGHCHAFELRYLLFNI